MMKRKIYENLRQWKDSGAKKPLMVIGARQIGKTFTIEEFCRTEFKKTVAINLAERADVVKLFAQDINTQEKAEKLELILGEKIDETGVVLFFDEIQESEELIESLKYFAESKKKYTIVCAGSLLGVKLKRFNRSFPVGKVDMLDMFPMDFEEFLWAMGQEGTAGEIRLCYETNRMMIQPLHEKCLKLFRIYLCSGGMPEAVLDMAEKDCDILLFKKSILSNIYHAYLYDMNKYIDTAMESSRIEAIYNSIPSQIGNQSRKFQYAKVMKSARAREFESAMNWLVSSRMVYICKAVSLPEAPLAGFQVPDVFKLYINDTGLLCSLLGVRLPDIVLDVSFQYKGVIVENYVASQLSAQQIPLFYWRVESRYEIDFLIGMASGIVPIEVKSGKNKHSSSLAAYTDRFSPNHVVRITANNFGFVNSVKSVPLYAIFCITAD